MLHFSIFIVILELIITVYGEKHSLGSIEYCADLKQRTNISISKITGTWFGTEIITHRENVIGERPNGDCIFIVIDKINRDMAPERTSHSSQPSQPFQPPQFPETPRPTQRPTMQPTQPPRQRYNPENTTPKRISSNSSSEASPLQSLSQLASDPTTDHRYLRLEWTESESKWEYIVRYSQPQLGFWLSSAPQQYRSAELPKFKVFAGTIQVIIASDNYLVLTFCELIPRQQLFSIILARHSNSLSMEVLRELRNKLRAVNLPTVYQRRVCNGIESVHKPYFILILVVVIVCISRTKWVHLYHEGI